MKVLLFTLPIFFVCHSFAQTVGVKAGVAFSRYAVESNQAANPIVPRSDIITTNKPGLILGGQVDFRLREDLFLRSGAELVVKGGIEEGVYTSMGTSHPYRESHNFTAFDFPIHLLYKMKTKGEQRLLFGGGIVPGILVESRLSKTDLGAGLLVGYEFANGLNYNVTYNHGLVNVATHSWDYKMLKNRHFGVTVGYQFRPSAPGRSGMDVIAPRPEAETQPAKTIYAELGGTGGFISLNYDTRLTKSNKGWGIRVGAGLISDLNSVGFTLPFGLNYLAGERSHFFETAVGATYFRFTEQNQDSWFSFQNQKFLAPSIWMGYRYQPPDKRFVFRAGINQFVASGFQGFMRYPFPGLSFGYSVR